MAYLLTSSQYYSISLVLQCKRDSDRFQSPAVQAKCEILQHEVLDSSPAVHVDKTDLQSFVIVDCMFY